MECKPYDPLEPPKKTYTLWAIRASQEDVSFWLGKFCNINFPAFHNLLVNALLEPNLSVDKFRSCNKTLFTANGSRVLCKFTRECRIITFSQEKGEGCKDRLAYAWRWTNLTRSSQSKSEPQSISTIFLDRIKWINNISQCFWHFSPLKQGA